MNLLHKRKTRGEKTAHTQSTTQGLFFDFTFITNDSNQTSIKINKHYILHLTLFNSTLYFLIALCGYFVVVIDIALALARNIIEANICKFIHMNKYNTEKTNFQ
jgi:hypothetical protein